MGVGAVRGGGRLGGGAGGGGRRGDAHVALEDVERRVLVGQGRTLIGREVGLVSSRFVWSRQK